MEQSHLNKLVKVLTLAYPYYFKEMNKEDLVIFNQFYYSKLKNYDYNTVARAIDKIISTNKYMPTMAEIISACDNGKKEYYKNVLKAMNEDGYFKTEREYTKAVTWLLEASLIPTWLKEDIDKFIEKSKINQIEMEENNGKYIEQK